MNSERPVITVMKPSRAGEYEPPDCDDLRPCLQHRLPVNKCALCWPVYLQQLGEAAWREVLRGRQVTAERVEA